MGSLSFLSLRVRYDTGSLEPDDYSMTDPVKNQIARAQVQGTTYNPAKALFDRLMKRGDDVRRARLSLEVHKAKNDLDFEQHRRYRDSHKETIEGLAGKGITAYGDTPLGGMNVRFDTSKAQPLTEAAASNTIPEVKDVYSAPANSMADHPRETNVPAPSTPIFIEPKYGEANPTKRGRKAPTANTVKGK